jgi:hypothetical protein
MIRKLTAVALVDAYYSDFRREYDTEVSDEYPDLYEDETFYKYILYNLEWIEHRFEQDCDIEDPSMKVWFAHAYEMYKLETCPCCPVEHENYKTKE